MALAGFASLAEPSVALMLVLGTLAGVLFGLLPGLGSIACIAMLTPLTYGFSPMEAVALMAGVMATTSTSGAVGSILLNAPRTAPTAATVMDGFPLAQRGRAGYAIGAAATASGLGGLLGLLVLFAAIPVLRELALACGPPEVFLLACVGVFAIGATSREGLAATLMVASLGLMLSLVGYDEISGEVRFAFGSLFLWDGLKLPAMMVGLFAGGEMLRLWIDERRVSAVADALGRGQVAKGAMAVLRRWPLLARSSAIGAGVGITPGVGGTVASFLAYAAAKATARRPARFGRGAVEGVLAPEASNNAKDGGALVPTLAFGIPGSGEMAVFFSGLIPHGITPGPTILEENADVIWMLLSGMAVAGVLASLITLSATRWLTRVALIEGRLLAPLALGACFLGAFAMRSDAGDVAVAVVFSLLGYLFVLARLPRAPFAIAFALGPLLETTLFQSLLIGDGQLTVFLRSPISLSLLGLLVVLALAPNLLRRLRGTPGLRGTGPQEPGLPAADLAVAAVVAALAVTVLIQGQAHAPAVRLFPGAAALLGLGAVVLLYWRGARVGGLAPPPPLRLLAILGFLAGYPALVELLGFPWATLAVTAFGLALVSRFSPLKTLGIAGAAAGFVWLVFGLGLGLRLTTI